MTATARGVAVVPLLSPSREEQLLAEVNELHERLEQVRCDVGSMPVGPTGDEEVVSIGGALIAEADGWLWLVWQGRLRPLWPSDADSHKQAEGTRSCIRRQLAEAQAKRGWLS